MYFRDTGLIDAKSRFVGMPEKLPLSATNFLEAFKMGVKNSQTVKMSEKEAKKKAEQERKEAEAVYQNVVAQENNGDSKRREELAADVKTLMKEVIRKQDANSTAELQKLLKANKVANEDVIKDLPLTTLQSLYDNIKKLK